MGQTLTHGVYLPDEGERNCYSGLAANWQLLDSSVGTIAEHTTALSGKAPLVHTHTKSDITDFPAYGTTAGTICEGNDSRLSDARTPVAHTHTKSDVTDLLNSNFIPSANNSYDLGSSSYQWNNLYAKNYFYNGVAWGLDKANVWTQSQTFKNSDVTIGTTTGSGYIAFNYTDSNSYTLAYQRVSKFSNGNTCLSWKVYNTDNNSQFINSELQFYVAKSGAKYFTPVENGEIALGTSINKWTTLNGCNPGALSLPKGYTEEGADKHYINIASVIQTLDGTLYSYTMPDNGWISVRAEQATQVHVTTDNWKFGQSIYSSAATTLIISIPFRKGDIVALKVRAVTLEHARFYPMQGNV